MMRITFRLHKSAGSPSPRVPFQHWLRKPRARRRARVTSSYVNPGTGAWVNEPRERKSNSFVSRASGSSRSAGPTQGTNVRVSREAAGARGDRGQRDAVRTAER